MPAQLIGRRRRVLHWGSAEQPLDFTTKDDVAAYVAAIALEDEEPHVLRIAGDSVSARDIAQACRRGSSKALSSTYSRQ